MAAVPVGGHDGRSCGNGDGRPGGNGIEPARLTYHRWVGPAGIGGSAAPLDHATGPTVPVPGGPEFAGPVRADPESREGNTVSLDQIPSAAPQLGTSRVKRGMAEMLKGGVIMDVVTPELRRSPKTPAPSR